MPTIGSRGSYALDYATLFEVIDPGTRCVALRFARRHFQPLPYCSFARGRRLGRLERDGDADLGLRLARFGYHVATFDSGTLEEVPAAVPAFLRQRTRWLKGWMQTLFINARNPLRLVARTRVFSGSMHADRPWERRSRRAALAGIHRMAASAERALRLRCLPRKSAGEFLHSHPVVLQRDLRHARVCSDRSRMAMQRQSLRPNSGRALLLWPIVPGLITIAAWGAATVSLAKSRGLGEDRTWFGAEVHAAAAVRPNLKRS